MMRGLKMFSGITSALSRVVVIRFVMASAGVLFVGSTGSIFYWSRCFQL